MAAGRSLALVSLLAASAAAAAAALPPPAGPYTVRLVQQESLLVVGEQPPPPPPPPQPLLDALSAVMRQLPLWKAEQPPVVQGLAGPLLDRATTTTVAPTTTTTRSEKTTRKGLLSFINAPDRPCPNGQLRDVTGQCREPW